MTLMVSNRFPIVRQVLCGFDGGEMSKLQEFRPTILMYKR